MSQTTLDIQKAPGHQILAATGKKYLRPGGRSATEQLLKWADFQPHETVLELAASFGYSAITLAQRYGVNVIGVEKNSESVQKARRNVQLAGLENQIEIIEGDIFHLEAISGQFNYVLAEAILSMQAASGKAKILTGVRQKLKPGGKFLSHELLAQAKEAQIHKDLAQSIRSNTTPISESGWLELCENAGLQVQQHKIGAMGLLSPRQMIIDEGLGNTLKIGWNIFTHPPIRQRVLQMRAVFQKYRHELGYIILCATTGEGEETSA
ncbi:SAM-dependent methyltransferase [Oscillatoria salina]|uniref:SAM-dependent methyltransferase n=1 Tax=Oscillatoria salina TaxID=331517 RepID=UPI0013B841CD|nr:class I SAM-dependent methyltransferase [Oscillatoria salina]MBZ8179822.1 methyltransferase domain-containing protein [Oscillatoria salina IIICB1]NET88107.1 methyltransferase domain-containing protein [Kamptonema sp. SIO1D9]